MYDMYPPPLYDMVRLWCVYLSLYLSISLSCSVPLARMCSLNNRLCSLRMSVVRLSLYPARSLARALSLFLSLSLPLSSISLSLSLSLCCSQMLHHGLTVRHANLPKYGAGWHSNSNKA